MSAPGPWGCSAENGDGPKRGKTEVNQARVAQTSYKVASKTRPRVLFASISVPTERGSDQAAPSLCAS
jgi:hypothetical protein